MALVIDVLGWTALGACAFSAVVLVLALAFFIWAGTGDEIHYEWRE